MEEVYGIHNAKFKQLALGLQYQSLDKGDVDTANIFSTDAQLASGKYTVLKDPKGVFGLQNVYFVINKHEVRRARRHAVHGRGQLVNALLTDRDPFDELGGRPRQEGPGGRRQVVPAGQLLIRGGSGS